MAIERNVEQRRRAFRNTATVLRKRIELFAALPRASSSRMSPQTKLDGIGKTNKAQLAEIH